MNLQTFLTGIITFLNNSVIPLLIAIAFLIFLWNAFRYFIIGGGNPESQEQARSLALWGITAFVVIFGIWGIINIFIVTLGLPNAVIVPDYMQQKSGSQSTPIAPPTGNIYQYALPQEL